MPGDGTRQAWTGRITDLVQPHLLTLAGYEAVDPPEVLAQRAGIPESELVKLDANENPYGPSPKVAEALAEMSRVHLYPDPAQIAMRTAAGAYVGVGKEHIVVGNGSDEIIDLLFRVVLAPGDAVLTCVPTFGMYEFTAHVCGGRLIAVERDASFAIDADATIAALDDTTKIIAIASPNNPSGNGANVETIERLVATGRLVIVDEAYAEFGGTSVVSRVGLHPNLVVLRTLSKWGGLAGMRVGYGIMDAELSEVLLRAKPPYNVSQAAEAAMLASFGDAELLNARAKTIVEERARMFAAIDALPGVTPLPSDANFILCRMPDGKGKAVYETLAGRGVFVRYYSRAALADYLRISVGTSWQTDRLIEALADALSS
jgi:histidinol-phosphate aminotransferase